MTTRSNNSEQLLPATENALKVRFWEKANLPIEQSALALDLFLVCLLYTSDAADE